MSVSATLSVPVLLCPVDGVPVSCPVNITNTGNVGLSALNVTSAAPNGTVLTCTNTSALSPYGMRGCQLSRTVSQVRALVCSCAVQPHSVLLDSWDLSSADSIEGMLRIV